MIDTENTCTRPHHDYSPDCDVLDTDTTNTNFTPTLYPIITGEEYNNHPEVLKHRKVTKTVR